MPTAVAESAKAVYIAVPLLDNDEGMASDSDESDSNASSKQEIHLPDLSLMVKLLHGLTGISVGVGCFAAMYFLLLLPMLAEWKNVTTNTTVLALIWSFMTTLISYGIWNTCCKYWKCSGEDQKESTDDTATLRSLFWKEYVFAVNVFWGFSASSAAHMWRLGAPIPYIAIVFLSCLVWTRVMGYALAADLIQGDKGNNSKTSTTSGTRLPIVMV